jgi:hypothetical protein
MAMLKFHPWDMNIHYFMLNSYKTWCALRKAWRGYTIAKNKYEYDEMKYYAVVIQKLQHELGLKASLFPDIILSKSYLSNKTEIIQEEQDEEQQLQDHSYEGEYFEGDFNKADRFTS